MASKTKKPNLLKVRWTLMFYDVLVAALVSFLIVFFVQDLRTTESLIHIGVAVVIIIASKTVWFVYNQIWRYGGVSCYLRMIFASATSGLILYGLEYLMNCFLTATRLNFAVIAAMIGLDLGICLFMRLSYRYCYRNMHEDTPEGKTARFLLRTFGRMKIEKNEDDHALVNKSIKVAIVGAGRTGTSLAEEMGNNRYSGYEVRCFIDTAREKIGRRIYQVPVFDEEAVTKELLLRNGVEEVIFALPNESGEEKQRLFIKYRAMGFKIKSYDYPLLASEKGDNKKTVRDFDIDELLFREPIQIQNENTYAYYKDKIIMITGGGGSIGSELARQVAKMGPKLILLVDIYENGAYDVQQELNISYHGNPQVKVEILSVTNRTYFEKLFKRYHVDVVIHAAAHKHVPLMERNSVEAITNNIFGTLTVVDLAYTYKCERCIMVSTDKAVNPTNVMGATKRMCEMIFQAYSTRPDSKTKFSMTRFGNVLGSAGSVIPLFKKQIANGGPVTLTDKRIIRYFMTIPEAAQLVLESGYLAKNGELFVLDMGKPVKILELAENMIRLSGYRPYIDIDIKEIGLRDGEKLYEELLVKTETLGKTSNKLIFTEKDEPISMEQMYEKLEVLKKAVETNQNAKAREAMHIVVPTYKNPNEVNVYADEAEEMNNVKETNENQ